MSSLFPAYAGKTEDGNHNEASSASLDWLTNRSFRSEDALTIQSRTEVADGGISQEEQRDDIDSDESVDEATSDLKPEPRTTAQPASDESGDIRLSKHHKKKKKHKKYKKHSDKDDKHSGRKRDHYEKREHHEEVKTEKNKSEIDRLRAESSVPSVQVNSGKVFIEEVHGLTVDHAFRLDRKRDVDNLTYGSLYKMHIARHKTHFWNCLGQPPNKVIILDKERQRKEKRKRKESRYFGKENTMYVQSVALRISRENTDEAGLLLSLNESFIPVPTDSELVDKCKSEENPLGIYDAETERYLTGVAPESSSATCRTVSENEATTWKHPQAVKVSKRSADLNHSLRENPNDIIKWLELIKLQDEAVAMETWGQDKEREHRKKLSLVIVEKKEAIVQKALLSNPGSVELKVFQLQLCRDTWDRSKLLKEWKELVFVHANDVHIWKQYLLFLQSFFPVFSVSTVLKAYSKCLSTLNSIVIGELKSHDPKPGTQFEMLEIVYQLGHFLKQSGHVEKAVALYQALVEFNVLVPDILASASHKDKLEIFEGFWDSGEARVGEPGSVGWDQWVTNKMNSDEAQSTYLWNADADQECEETVLKKAVDKAAKWLEIERIRANRHWLPWRPNASVGETEEDIEDPERMILIDDISSWLFTVHSEELKFQLIRQFLEMLDVNGTWERGSRVHELALKLSLDSSASCCLNKLSGWDNHFPIQCLGIQLADEMLSSFVEGTIKQVNTKFSTHYRTSLTLMCIDFQRKRLEGNDASNMDPKTLKHKKKELKRTVKSLLKDPENRNNLALWEAFATLEWSFGNHEETSRILKTAENINAMNVTNVKDLSLQSAAIKLCRSHVELELGIIGTETQIPPDMRNQIDIDKTVLSVLVNLSTDCHVSVDSEITPTHLLKANKHFKTHIDKILKDLESRFESKVNTELLDVEHLCNIVTDWTACFAVFQFVSVGSRQAFSVYQNTIEFVKNSSSCLTRSPSGGCYGNTCHRLHEDLVIDHMTLLQFLVSRQRYRLADLRLNLQQALAALPHSWDLLCLYVKLESRTNIAGRLRRYFQHATLISDHPSVWLCALFSELLRWQKVKGQRLSADVTVVSYNHSEDYLEETGLTHRIKAWFDRLTTNPSTQHSVLVWRLYFKFQMELGQRDSAMATFYTALQHVPHAKLLFLDVVAHCPDELQRMIDLITEKELRIHLPLEELDVLLQ